MMSRQQLYRMEATTTSGCRDTNCKDQKVATSVSLRRGRDKIKLSRHHLHLRHVATTQRLLRQGLRQGRRQGLRQGLMSRRGLYVATISVYWASLLKSKKKCIQIRAQLQNPINMQLLKKKRSWVGDLIERSGLLKAPVFLFLF